MPPRGLEERLAQLAERLKRLEDLSAKQAKDLEIQFQRIAQIQAQLDRRSAPANVEESANVRAKCPQDH
jgi:hypothetical protein